MTRFGLGLVLMGMALVCGCAKNAPPATRPSAVSISDPCAERLHEIAGLLLHYYAINGDLPVKLEDALKLSPESAAQSRACPVSREPYGYDPNGPVVESGGKGRIVVYDAKAVHDGNRWGIAVSVPRAGAPMTARILIVPASAVR